MNRVWPQSPPARIGDPLENALAEIEVSIELVRRRQARRVRLCGLAGGEVATGFDLARAQAAGVRFALERGAERGLAVSLLIGPVVYG